MNCRKHRETQQAKDADRLEPKGKAVGCPFVKWRHTDIQTAGEKTGTNSFMLLERNTVNPTTRLTEAGAAVKHADELTGRGCWKKRTPSGNRMDREGSSISPRKRADFQRVIRDEITRRTFVGGNRK